ncbi:protein serine/threonine phosphatase [Richelia sinica FACHB-800]|uniref:Protein serine/threonine phosphatase n=2 Tax=Richelia TaxID=98443 RepID=A0A975TA90_9NOST|nr:protein serine/threonine phosphatase [Richelia sinica FACHB-800]
MARSTLENNQGTSTMLICPQCKFENPNQNKFCQSCGTSLVHKICPDCGTPVELNLLNCHNCGAECGPIWWAIITQEKPVKVASASTTQLLPASKAKSSDTIVSTLPPQFFIGSYLDPEERYQLLEQLPTPEVIAANTEVKVRVLDCQPYQISPIEAILEHEPKGLPIPSLGENKIPPLAKAYIELQSKTQAEIPQIHDAWEHNNMQVILIEDRSQWDLLLDVWQEDTTSPLQILHWFYQMTQLWSVLESVGCRQSLLDLSNLRLDEDQTIALQRLYLDTQNYQNDADPESQELTIKTLGRVWQTLFRQSQRTQIGAVVQMLEHLENGTIQTLGELRSRLEEIAADLETIAARHVSPPTPQYNSPPTVLQLDEETTDSIAKNDDVPTVVLSMQLNSLEDVGMTDVGRQRRHNEDYFGIETKIEKLEFPKSRLVQAKCLYVLCDGMGGHAGGEIASQLAVNAMRQYFQENWLDHELPSEQTIREAVYLANQTIYNLNQQDARSGVARMGTTLVMLLIQDTEAAVAHVGDSRLYRITRKRGLELLTVDHEVGQQEIAKGIDPSIAYSRPDAYQLTQALGPRHEKSIHPDVEFFSINEDTLLLLASDGLSDNDLLEINWQTHLAPLLSSNTNLETGIFNLIELANQHNGHDNITAVLVRVKVRPSQETIH